MDAVTRQVGQHMEYEPEWESAFNLHIKLQPVMQLSLEWCGANKSVFIRAYRLGSYNNGILIKGFIP
jgi:E3 ubiquitin-protein ligase UBR2